MEAEEEVSNSKLVDEEDDAGAWVLGKVAECSLSSSSLTDKTDEGAEDTILDWEKGVEVVCEESARVDWRSEAWEEAVVDCDNAAEMAWEEEVEVVSKSGTGVEVVWGGVAKVELGKESEKLEEGERGGDGGGGGGGE